MKGHILLLFAAMLTFTTACSVTRNTITTRTPDVVRLNIDMDDVQCLGETELTIEYRTYLGFIRVKDKINGIPYDRKGIKTTTVKVYGSSFGKMPSIFRYSAYKLAEDFPDADYFTIVNGQKKKTNLFLGGSAVSTLKIKAYKLK